MTATPPPEPIVCRRCQRAQPAEAFYRIYATEERAQPCIACCQHPTEPEPEGVDAAADQALTAARAEAATHARRALTVCERVGLQRAGMDLAAMLFRDAVDVLAYPDLGPIAGPDEPP